MSIPVIMDCDPGHDDAIALVLAVACPEIDLRAVTTSAGNQTIDKTTLNARKVLGFLGSTVSVARGAPRPLFRDLITAAAVHGESGLDGPVLPAPRLPESQLSAVDLMAKTLRESERRVTLVPTAALTNVATLFLTYPELKAKIERVCLMGGSAEGGNWTPAAEFNILVDPEAAHIVFNAGLPVMMCGLDVTHKAFVTREDIERFRSIGGRAAVMVAELLDFFGRYHEASHEFAGSPLHDPCTIAYLADPSLFSGRRAHVDVECRSRLATGATVVDFRGRPGRERNVEVILDVDRARFVDFIDAALRRLE